MISSVIYLHNNIFVSKFQYKWDAMLIYIKYIQRILDMVCKTTYEPSQNW